VGKVHIELTTAGKDVPVSLQVEDMAELRAAVASRVGADDFHILERDAEEPLGDIGGRKAVTVVAHRCKKIDVTVVFDREITRDFPTSTTINKILSWAISKKGFDLDDDQQGKANLILPGGESPLPREAMVGQFVTVGTCATSLELTLKDFTNGRR
jgi:hypothetical protein